MNTTHKITLLNLKDADIHLKVIKISEDYGLHFVHRLSCQSFKIKPFYDKMGVIRYQHYSHLSQILKIRLCGLL